MVWSEVLGSERLLLFVETAAVAASGVSEKSEYKLEYRSSTDAVAIRKVVKVECGPSKKRQVIEIIGRDHLTRDAVASIATQATGLSKR